MPIEPTTIAELRRLHQAATGGAWVSAPFCSILGNAVLSEPAGPSVASARRAQDSAFIAAAHAHLPALLDEITRLRQERDAAVRDARQGAADAAEAEASHRAEISRLTEERDRERGKVERAMADLSSALDVLILRINGQAGLASAAQWLRQNYPKKSAELTLL